MDKKTMDAFKISVKFYVEEDSRLSLPEFVPILHSWIQNKSVPDHVLIDVADYEHVHNGPGMVLVALEANFYTDRFDGRLGLTYSRKTPAQGSFPDRLRQACNAALEACRRLESDPRLAGRIRFGTREATIRLDDRLLAPNTPETFERVRADLEALGRTLWPGAKIEIEHDSDEEVLFTARLRGNQPAEVSSLLARTEGFAA